MAITPPPLDLQFVSDQPPDPSAPGPQPHSEVFGVSITKVLMLQTYIDSVSPPDPDIDNPFWIPPPPDEEPPPGPPDFDWAQWVYGVKLIGGSDVTLNLGTYAAFFPIGDVYPVYYLQRRPTTYFRVQADGGGRQVMYASYGDDSPLRFFELWKDGVRFSFIGLPDPKVLLRSPSGQISQPSVYMRGRPYGRFAVEFGELNEIGDWKMQIQFIEEADSLGANSEREPMVPGPSLPLEPILGELWRSLHNPLILRVCKGSEDIW